MLGGTITGMLGLNVNKHHVQNVQSSLSDVTFQKPHPILVYGGWVWGFLSTLTWVTKYFRFKLCYAEMQIV